MSSDLASAGSERPALPPPPAPYVAPPKSPGLALLLSMLLPGVGQAYNAQPAKALVFFFGFVGSIYGTAEIGALPFGFLIPFVYFYGLVDAYRSAALINARFAGRGSLPDEDTAESPAWGATLIGIGLLLLANNLGWLDLVRFQRFWPLLLVALGVVLLRGSLRRKAEG